VTGADLRRIALGLAETCEDLHRRRPAFRVNKRIFAMLGVTGNESLFTSLGREISRWSSSTAKTSSIWRRAIRTRSSPLGAARA
jgi:hypothetical protein